MINMRFGRKLKLPSTLQIKHQILTMWLADQRKKEADEQAMMALRSTPLSIEGTLTLSITR